MINQPERTKRHRTSHPQSSTHPISGRSSCFKSHHEEHLSRKRKKYQSQLPPTLPYDSHPLVKDDFKEYKYTFALYLDIQKNKILEDLDEKETKGRWKSFMHKWNRGELSEGWYDPSTKRKARENVMTRFSQTFEDPSESASTRRNGTKSVFESESVDGNLSDRSFGPVLPGQEMQSKTRRLGPTIPSTQDIQVMSEIDAEARIACHNEIKLARKADRKEQKAALDELIPQSMAGTRERQLEKKKELNEKMKSFREKSPGTTDIPDSDLIGDRNDFEFYKKAKQEMERKKNERELRKEAFLRIRVAEREERLREYRIKEEATIGMFKALAKERFG
ncbi:hypothetical protein OnM2_003003 [Erysiphe neolycopersici]|uniref:Uncharacterized protein n=1 Tax=Erysiphe neolycopersici TaxID=212602 RepID=A0A420I7U1_9PEZI|nr:hypothetical protein OnM2_003003 [Erysiphe neolycopersici]